MPMFFPPRVLIAALCCVLPWSGAQAAARNPHGVAVIVGNRDYKHTDDVRFAHRDAEAFRTYAVEFLGLDPKRIIDLRDVPLTRMIEVFGNERDFRGAIWRRLDGAGRSDVVVFYSGHGAPGLRDKRGYLVPVDAKPDSVELSGYLIDVLYANLGKLKKARSVAVYLDACFSGDSQTGMLVKNASPVRYVAALPKEVGRRVTVLTAASGKEVASWDKKARHGLFTRHLLDALYGDGDGDDDGRVTAEEAKAYLDRHMTAAARQVHGREQTASFRGSKEVVLSRARFVRRSRRRAEPENRKVVEEKIAKAPNPPDVEKEVVLDRKKKVLVQRGLASLGLYKGFMDGAFGPKTRESIRSWQKAKGYEETGRLTREQADALVSAGKSGRRAPSGEAEREFWASVKESQSPSDLDAYLKAYPEGEYAVLARFRRDKLVGLDDGSYARARSAGTAESYGEYLSSYPSGRHVEAARRAREKVERALLRPGRVFRDCPECPEMVVVPAGSFMMGSAPDEEGRDNDEGPVHRVTIEKPFAVGKYEVMFAEWDACVADGGCGGHRPGDKGWGRGRRPVINVSWNNAKAYVRWLSDKTGKPYRLLSEAEWEYAARAGTTTRYNWGDDIGRNRANCDGCGSGWDNEQTAPVGSFPANGFGLYDLHGNVWEWVEDCRNPSYAGAPADGSARINGDCSSHVLRGGSWYNEPKNVRVALRISYATESRSYSHGFRVARTLRP